MSTVFITDVFNKKSFEINKSQFIVGKIGEITIFRTIAIRLVLVV